MTSSSPACALPPDSGWEVSLTACELSRLQLRVARRADELARRMTACRVVDRMLWLRAEFEIFELVEFGGEGGA